MTDVEELLARLRDSDPAIWIDRLDDAAILDAYAALDRVPPGRRGVLHGQPFAVKDNIDVAGRVTTAGLPGAAYTATTSAPVVERLEAAGAVLVGKTNLDQLATGLVGTRSPYGTPVNPLDPMRVPGGSSSGSAVAVALGLVRFALGTDTAGSGRVPAACTGVVGLKAAPGAVPLDGVVPASPSFDCVSVFADDVTDAVAAHEVLAAATWPAAAGRFTVGVPHPRWRGGVEAAEAEALANDARRLELAGHTVVDVDMAPLFEAGELLYGGALVAERAAAVAHLLADDIDGVDPIVRQVIGRSSRWTAVDAFAALRRLDQLRRQASTLWRTVDALLVPSVPAVPTLAEVAADPIGVNERLGRFTTFANLLGLAAITVPTGPRPDGLVSSATVLAPGPLGPVVRTVASCLAGDAAPVSSAAGPAPGEVDLAVVGAHLRGKPLNEALTRRGAVLVEATTTAQTYRLHHLAGGPPERPGLERVTSGGRPVEVEVWRLDERAFGAVVAEVAPPLGIGSLELRDGRWVKGFVCEGYALGGGRDITAYGGWRAYVHAGQRAG